MRSGLKEKPNKSVRAEPVEAQPVPAQGFDKALLSEAEGLSPNGGVLNRRFLHGAATVEFALVAIVFFSLLLAIMEFGRILFAFNSAAEATRFGARVAVVCDPNSQSLILARMQRLMPAMTSANATISYLPSGCDVNTCQQVRVSLTGISYRPLIPFANFNITLQPFTTTLTRESLQSSIGGDASPECS